MVPLLQKVTLLLGAKIDFLLYKQFNMVLFVFSNYMVLKTQYGRDFIMNNEICFFNLYYFYQNSDSMSLMHNQRFGKSLNKILLALSFLYLSEFGCCMPVFLYRQASYHMIRLLFPFSFHD